MELLQDEIVAGWTHGCCVAAIAFRLSRKVRRDVEIEWFIRDKDAQRMVNKQ